MLIESTSRYAHIEHKPERETLHDVRRSELGGRGEGFGYALPLPAREATKDKYQYNKYVYTFFI